MHLHFVAILTGERIINERGTLGAHSALAVFAYPNSWFIGVIKTVHFAPHLLSFTDYIPTVFFIVNIP